jgi:hypothetical protein
MSVIRCCWTDSLGYWRNTYSGMDESWSHGGFSELLIEADRCADDAYVARVHGEDQQNMASFSVRSTEMTRTCRGAVLTDMTTAVGRRGAS